MVLAFQSIRAAIQQNPLASLQVAAYRLRPAAIVESFKLPTIPIEAVVIPKRPTIRTVSPSRSEEALEPVPQPRIAPVPQLPTSAPPVPTSAPPVPTSVPPVPTSVPQLPTYPSSPSPPPSPPREPRGRPVDPLCIALEARDAMYAIANHTAKQSIEAEEARRIEGLIGKLYKEESGRSRGWVKTKLEAFMMPRAAVGSRIQPKDAFDWSKIWGDKEASAILDFICIAKGIRLAVWRDAEKVVGIWPAADQAASNPTIFHVNAQGVPVPHRDILQSAYALKAPLSVENALEKLTIDELNSVAEKLGIAEPAGKKVDKVRVLASHRMRMRFQV